MQPNDATDENSKVFIWDELTRDQIRELAPEALVLVPVGAIEQHGPFMPTGTDILLATGIVTQAAKRAVKHTGVPLIIASFLRIGSSDHHLPFGGTISLPPSTMLLVLTDAIKSMARTGVRRVALINGHGGNTGVCHAAAAAISTTTDMTVAALDYFEHASEDLEMPVPGHAGCWETSLILATRPELVQTLAPRDESKNAKAPGRGVYSAGIWDSINGYTDEPYMASAEAGQREWAVLKERLADRFVELARDM